MATKFFTSPTTQNSNNFESDCQEIHDSWGGHLCHLLRALACRSRLELRQIRDTYREMYGEDLTRRLQQRDGAMELSSDARWALTLFLLDPHNRDAVLADEAVKQDETDYAVLVEIFTGRKSSHIELIKRAYLARFRRRLDQDIVSIEPPHPFQRVGKLIKHLSSFLVLDFLLCVKIMFIPKKVFYVASIPRDVCH